MKRVLSILIIILILASCTKDYGLENVNYNIFPYLEFELSPSATYYVASVIDGSKAELVVVPSYIHTPFGKVPVGEFAGYQNKADAKYLKELHLSAETSMRDAKSLEYASDIEILEIKNIDDDISILSKLPMLKTPGKHFIGWYIGDERADRINDLKLNDVKLTPKFEANSSDHSYIYNYDNENHWLECSKCYEKKENSTSPHEWFLTVGAKTCKICGYSEKAHTSSFSVNIIDPAPNAELTYIDNKDDTYTFTLTDNRQYTEFKVTKINWYLNDLLSDNISTSFTFEATNKCTYKLMCRYENDQGYRGSETIVVDGGQYK